MTEAFNFIINKYEIALFPNNLSVSDWLGVANRIKDSIPEFKNHNSAVLPVPPGAPSQTPRIFFKSEKEDFICTISFARIDVSWINKKEDEKFEEETTYERRIEMIEKICSSFEDLNSFKRVGFITEFFYKVENNKRKEFPEEVLGKNADPGKELKNYLCNMTFDIKMDTFNEECNQVIIIGNGLTDNTKEKVVILRSDINTHQSKNFNGNLENVKKFMEEANKKSLPNELYKQFVY